MNEENKDALNNLIHSIQEKMGNNVENSDEASPNISSLLNTLNSSNNSSQENEKKQKSRQDKMGDYLTILSVISVLESFKNKGSD